MALLYFYLSSCVHTYYWILPWITLLKITGFILPAAEAHGQAFYFTNPISWT